MSKLCANCQAKQPESNIGHARHARNFLMCLACGHDCDTSESFESWCGTAPTNIDAAPPEQHSPAFEGEIVGFSSSTQDEKSGQKHDQGKAQWDLLPWEATTETVEVLTFGGQKYGPDNWRKVPNAKRRYTAAAFRHFTAWLRGEKHDPESGKHHLAHVICCALFLLEMDLTTSTEQDA